MRHRESHLERIRHDLGRLGSGRLRDGIEQLLDTLGYKSPKTLDTGGRPEALIEALGLAPDRIARTCRLQDWLAFDIVFQLTEDELPALARGSVPRTDATRRDRDIDSFLFLAIDLGGKAWTRGEFVAITREINRATAMPAVLAFRHEGRLTLAVIDRRAHRRDPNRAVVGGRISLVKDVVLASPHRAHIEILADLTLASLRPPPIDFVALYDRWLEALSAAELNKRFYGELADWFAWAVADEDVSFPPGQGNTEPERQVALIRLLTRLIFVWFIKEKRLVPDELFEEASLAALLKAPPHAAPDDTSYYPAVLQNLFFACLNTEGERGWLPRSSSGRTEGYMTHTHLRGRDLFAEPDRALALFSKVPFLNGGLFDCLDDDRIGADDERRERASKEGARLVLRVDGFSDDEGRRPNLPNRLFFGGTGEDREDLSRFFQKPRRAAVRGLVDILSAYKFTVEENTPLAEEAALDPELLGKVFENLLASYNKDTETTARKQSGSFYTPREVVDFMIDEALVAYLAPVIVPASDGGVRPKAGRLDFGPGPGELLLEPTAPSGERRADPLVDAEARILKLLSYEEDAPSFTETETRKLIAAIEKCRAIDPAVGSGAFPIGLLQKLVHVLGRLDPDNVRWCEANRKPYERALAEAETIPSPADRAQAVKAAKERLAHFDESFSSKNFADYARKLYLIEGCLHGVDIQPIAVQIAKLRCFIALAVEQKVDENAPNRGITPLPNLEMNFVAANALRAVGPRRGETFALRDTRIKETLDALRSANRDFFAARSRVEKRTCQNAIEDLIARLRMLFKDDHVLSDTESDLVARWNPFDANASAPFFDPVLMFGFEQENGEGAFDLVLANPPYIRHEKFESLEVPGGVPLKKEELRRVYDAFDGKADILVYFFERAVRFLKPGGALAFITSNKWYRAGYGAKLRAWLNAQVRLRSVIDFGDANVFEAVAYPTIVVARRRPAPVKTAPPQDTFRALTWDPNEESYAGFSTRFRREAFEMPQSALLASGWQLEPTVKRDLLARLREKGTALRQFAGGKILYGVKTGYNEAFVIDSDEADRLIAEDPSNSELILPFLRGRDVKRWVVEAPSRWIIFLRQGTPVARFPSLLRHLEKYRSRLEPRPTDWDEISHGSWQGRKGGAYKWYEIQDTVAYWEKFRSKKIVFPDISIRNQFAFDCSGAITADTTFIIPDPADELLGVLNSAMADWVMSQISPSIQNGYRRNKMAYVGEIPIPGMRADQFGSFVAASNAILAGAKPRERFEALINAFVYEFFLPEDLAARSLSPFAAAREAGLDNLATLTGDALARAAEDWSRAIVDPQSKLYATLFELQSIESVRIIEGR